VIFCLAAEKIMQENETEEIRTKALYLLGCVYSMGNFMLFELSATTTHKGHQNYREIFFRISEFVFSV
jgi:hypothetical protein